MMQECKYLFRLIINNNITTENLNDQGYSAKCEIRLNFEELPLTFI